MWRAGVNIGTEDVVERGKGEKWLKPEGNKVQKVQLGPEVVSSLPQPAQGHGLCMGHTLCAC